MTRHRLGRPPSIKDEDMRRIGVYLKLPRWLARWLREGGNESQSSVVEKALIHAFGLNPPKGK